MRLLVLLSLLLMASTAAAQDPPPPGPWVIDLRAVTSGLSSDSAFFPVLPTDTRVPSRGLGFDAGAHLYFATLGPARVGLGANYVRVRGTAEGIESRFATLAPQVSFNFGTADGWSYLSAGWGRAWVETTAATEAGTATRESSMPALNVGGGARWFLTSHMAVGFDVRFHRLSGTPRATLVSGSVGLSVK